MNLTVCTHGAIEYYLRGSQPNLLILSGLHGDEHEVIDCVINYVNKHHASLPDFLFIPYVSPSAARLRSRRNQYNNDINRQFFMGTADPESQNIMEVLSPYQFNLCLEFHEDPDRTLGFYVYDSDLLTETQLEIYRTVIHNTGARLYTGLDDPFDAHLGFHVERGYISTPLLKLPPQAGFLMQRLLANQKARRLLNPEIPGKAPPTLKQALVEAVFNFFLQFS